MYGIFTYTYHGFMVNVSIFHTWSIWERERCFIWKFPIDTPDSRIVVYVYVISVRGFGKLIFGLVGLHSLQKKSPHKKRRPKDENRGVDFV